ncbi:MAG: substrate-binding domain-containing protein [Prevotella sp.]|nr:substrate-binding domain-containing protein [Prevotella sp.]
MTKNAFHFIGLTLILGLFLACGNKPKNTKAEEDYRKAARYFVADESFSPILNEAIDVFRYQNVLDTLEAEYTNEQEAIQKLMRLETWLAFTSRDLTEKERQNLKDRKYMPRTIPLAYDGLAIIVNNANPDSCITVNDFCRILKGENVDWKDIYPESRLGSIDVVFDNPLSSTVRWCVDSLLAGQEIKAPNIGAVKTSVAVIDYVEQHPNALGIIGSNWLNDSRDTTNVTFKKNIRVMKVSKMQTATTVNSYAPYQYYLYTGQYPLIRTIYALLNEPRGGLPSGFAHFCRLPQGQKIILKSGLLPIQAAINTREVIVNKQ